MIMKSVHSGRLERWLGSEAVARVGDAMRDWYGPPVALYGIPGAVFATRGGDFIGDLRAGGEMSTRDVFGDVVRRLRRGFRVAARRAGWQLNAGFASVGDLISEATTGAKRQSLAFQKTGVTGVAGRTSSLWAAAGHPAAGTASASGAPGGDATTVSTTGAIGFNNAAGGDTLHVVSGNLAATVAANSLLLYDRLFQVAKTMSSTGTEAVTGVPTRYQNTTSGTADSAEGNFVFVETATTLGATAHNWTVCQYTAQGGATGHTLPSVTGNSGNIAPTLDHPLGQWFAPLAAGDTGIKELSQMQCSANVTGAANFVIGHPIAWLPCPVAYLVSQFDMINTAFSLPRVFDSACLAFLEVTKPSTTATSYCGELIGVSG